MRNPRESQYSNGAIPPDPEEARQLNALHGPIPQPSRLLKGTVAVLGLGTVAFLADACARPNQPAEVHPAPTNSSPIATEEIREIPKTPIATASQEKPVEQEGWRTFRSLNYPYQINYPSNWLAVSSRFGENKVDILEGPTIQRGKLQINQEFKLQIKIYAEEIAPHVTFDDYLKQVLDKSQMSTRRWTKEEYDRTVTNMKNIPREWGPLIDGKRVPIIINEISSITIGGNNDYRAAQDTTEVIFLARGQAWHLQYTYLTLLGRPPIFLDEEREFLSINRFYGQIVPSFKVLQGK